MQQIKYFLSITLFFSAISSLFSQDLPQYKRKEFIQGKDTLRYRLLLPENYQPTKKYPLVIFLHGAYERGKDNNKQLRNGASLFLQPANRKNFPSIVIFPQCPRKPSYWSSVILDATKKPYHFDFNYSRPMTQPLQSTLQLVHQLIAEDKIDTTRIYIMGLSMGGMGTLEAVYHNPNLFAAAIPICGGGDVTAFTEAQTKIPFWFFHGDQDEVVEVKYSRQLVARLKELNTTVTYTEYPAVKHNSWEKALAEPELLRWLFSHHK
jgi:predicted peptidase